MLQTIKKVPPKLLNLALLIMGYGSGQGTIFLAQTWLLATNELKLVALFGLHFTTATLAILIVEAGSITLLARKVASQSSVKLSSSIWQAYFGVSTFRFAIALAILGVCGIVLTFAPASPFTHHYVFAAAPALLVWSLNVSGVLDGLKLSGVTGVTTSVPSLFSGIALVLIPFFPSLDPGTTLGAAFSLGYFSAIALQLFALTAMKIEISWETPTRNDIVAAARDGFLLLGSQLPGQLYFRLQLQLCHIYLGADSTALFLYIKQIFVALAQLIWFIRRIEFPYLVRKVTRLPQKALPLILITQRGGTIFSLVVTIFILITGIVMSSNGEQVFREVGFLLAIFAPFIAINSMSLAFNQGLAALARFPALMVAMLITTAVGATLSTLLIGAFGVAGLLASDAIAEVASVAMLLVLLIRGERGKHG